MLMNGAEIQGTAEEASDTSASKREG